MAEELVELGRKKCGNGRIRRKGFVRKDGTRVGPTCVRVKRSKAR